MSKAFRKNDICPKCGTEFTVHDTLKGGQVPQKDDVSICYKCQSLLVFDEDLKLRCATQEDIDRLKQDTDLWNEIWLIILGLKQVQKA